MTPISEELLKILRCPASGEALHPVAGGLESSSGDFYPVVEGVPILLVGSDLPQFPAARRSWEAVLELRRGTAPADGLFLDTVGITPEERVAVGKLGPVSAETVDPVVSWLVEATGGRAYSRLKGKLRELPIPAFPIETSSRDWLLDIGCSWGRWTFAAERSGWRPVGVDPSLGAVLAARRTATAIGSSANFVVADGRHLPFVEDIFRGVHSFSVLQHLSDSDARRTVLELWRVMEERAAGAIQIAGRYGMMGVVTQARRGFRAASDFEVRYRSPTEIHRLFDGIPRLELIVDSFFGLGLQASELDRLRGPARVALLASETLKHWIGNRGLARWIADSLWVRWTGEPSSAATPDLPPAKRWRDE